MIKSVKMEAFGPINSLNCEGLGSINLLIGENGSGKTTLLKALYSALKSVEQFGRGKNNESLAELLQRKIYWTYQVDPMGALVHKGKDSLLFEMVSDQGETMKFAFGASTAKKITRVSSDFAPRAQNSIFLPAKEVLSLQGVIDESRSEKFNDFGFDDTYYDLSRALQPPTKGKNIKELSKSRGMLSEAIGGRIEFDKGRNEWVFKGRDRAVYPISLTSEGVKKISILDVLLGNHYLSRGSVIIIDEPESALHPKLISVYMDIVSNLAQSGFQIFIASHSYFVIKKLYLIAQQRHIDIPVLSFEGKAVVQSNLKDGMHDNPIIDASIALYEEELSL